MTRSGSTLRRVLLGSVLGLVALAALTWTFGPRLLSGYARGVALDELQARGIDADIGGLALSATQAVITDLCVHGPDLDADTPAVCLNVVRVRFVRPGPLSTDIRPTEVRIDGGVVDLSADRGDVETQRAAWEAWIHELTGERDRDEDRERDPNRERDEKRLDVRVRNLDVRLNEQGLPVQEVHIDDLGLTLTRGEVSLDVELELEDIDIPGDFDVEVPEEWRVAAHQSDEAPLTVSLMTDGLVRATAPTPLDGVRLAFSGVSITMPWYLSLQDVQIDVPGQSEPLVRFPTATLEVQHWPTSLDDFFMTSLDVASPEVMLALDDDGQPTALRALGLIPPATEATPLDDPASDADADADPAEDVEPEPSDGPDADPGTAGDSADGEADEASTPLWADRIWWQKIPQQIRLHDATIAVQRGADPTRRVALTNLSLQYALRIFHFQLDVTIDGDLRLGDDPAGDVDLVARWGWTRSHLRLDAALQNVDLAIAGALSGRAPSPLTGRTDLDLRFYEAPRGPGLQSDGRLAVRGLAFDVSGRDDRRGLLSGPVEVGDVTWTWDASRSRDEEPVAFRWHRSDLTVGDVTASIAPTFYDFHYDRPPFFSRVDLAIEVPLQSAQALFDAVPRVLTGPLAGTEMAGDWGLRLTFPIEWVDREDGTRGIEIGSPTDYAVLQDGLELLSLPNAVDVRRMNRAFDFTFRGPDDAINRTLSVPAPRNDDEAAPDADPGTAEDAPPAVTPRPEVDGIPWARLDDISYYLIATQLYREDGRFFENRGINWYQLRRALEEAWDAGRLTRGASTITMQTVKNVFLTHERSIERKLQELFLTAWMTRLVPKERILEVYLNVIEWGPDVNGIVEAAEHYFGKTPAELTFAESVWLSAITPAPQRRAPQREMGTPPDWSMRLVHDLMRGMESRELITAEELAKGLEQEILFVTHPRWGDDAVIAPRPLLPEGLLAGVDTADPGALRAPAPIAPMPPPDRGPFLSLSPRERIAALIARSIPLATPQ